MNTFGLDLEQQARKKNNAYLNRSVMVLTLDVPFDAAAKNDCSLQANVPSRDRAVRTVGGHKDTDRPDWAVGR